MMKKNGKKRYLYIGLLAVVILVFIGETMSGFYKDIQTQVYGTSLQSMQNISMQGGAVVEKNLEGYLSTLYGMERFLNGEQLHQKENIDRLREFLQEHTFGFQRLAIADSSGKSVVTNGEELNISDRTFYQTCMEEQKAAIEIRESEVTHKPVCIVAVPILTDAGQTSGVLYGIIELGVFNIYNNTVLEDEEQYIQIVDKNGTYVMKEASSLIGKKDNIFEGLATVESTVSIPDIKEKMDQEQQFFTEITDGTFTELVYFTPLKLNDWCVVTVMDRSKIIDTVDGLLGNRVYIMILKVAGVILALCILLLFLFWKDGQQVRRFNEEMKYDEGIFRIASEKAGFVIMSYSLKNRQLRFINNTLMNLEFPRQMDNAPEEIMKYIPDDPELKAQVRSVFDCMEKKSGRWETSIEVHHKNRTFFLRLQMTGLTDEQGNVKQYVGIIEDTTEKQVLQEKADKDPLTGLYNRNKAGELIVECLKKETPARGNTHACMIMDIDNFKTLNDTLGHQMGDRALKDVSEILRKHFRKYDILCRLGGDEFLIFIKNIPENVIQKNVTNLLQKLELKYENETDCVKITASAGIALVNERDLELNELYRRADMALYEVKHRAKNSFMIYRQNNGCKRMSGMEKKEG